MSKCPRSILGVEEEVQGLCISVVGPHGSAHTLFKKATAVFALLYLEAGSLLSGRSILEDFCCLGRSKKGGKRLSFMAW